MTMTTLKTYVNFAGNCREALHYYERHLGGSISSLMTHAQIPGPRSVDPEWRDMVLHARLALGGTELMAADVPKAEPMRSAYLSLNVDSDQEAERIFAALADGGRILMKLEETFFASRFGQVQDRFGINWMILNERPAPAA
jgi:PhnB protein